MVVNADDLERDAAGLRDADRPTDFDGATRAAVALRSGGWCEAMMVGCEGAAVHLHHRLRRGHGDHRAVNALHVCAACHGWIHANVAASYDRGWLVRTGDDPADIPIT